MSRANRRRPRTATVVTLLISSGGCGGSGVTPPETVGTGTVEVSLRMVGTGADPDGVDVVLLGPPGSPPKSPQRVGMGGTARFTGLLPGPYEAVATDVSSLCAPSPTLTVTVSPNATARGDLDLDCVGGLYFVVGRDNRFTFEFLGTDGVRHTMPLTNRFIPVDIAPDGSGVIGLEVISGGAGYPPLRGAVVASDGTITRLEVVDGASNFIPVWSPQGDVIADWGADPVTDWVAMFDAETGAALTPLVTRQNLRTPQWSKSGRKVAFSVLDTVFVFDRDTDVASPVLVQPGWGIMDPLGWSADDQYILARSWKDNVLYLLLLRPTDRALVIALPIDNLTDVAWDPTASRFLMTARNEFGQRHLSVFDVASQSLSTLVTNVENVQAPNWAADGQEILFSGSRGSDRALYMYAFADSTARMVVEEPGSWLLSPRWQGGSGPRYRSY